MVTLKQLFQAAGEGKHNFVVRQFKKNRIENPNTQDREGCTLLHRAVKYPNTLSFLLKQGLNPNIRNNRRQRPIDMLGRSDEAKQILRSHQAYLNEEVDKAARKGDLERFRELIGMGANIGRPCKHNQLIDNIEFVCLQLFYDNCDISLEENMKKIDEMRKLTRDYVLLESSQDNIIKKAKSLRKKPLFDLERIRETACDSNGNSVVANFVRQNACHLLMPFNEKAEDEQAISVIPTINRKNKDGLTPFHHFVYSGDQQFNDFLHRFTRIPKLLLNCQDSYGWTVIHHMLHAKYYSRLVRLLEEGVDVNTPDQNGFTALHLAVYEGDLKAIDILCGHGAKLQLLTKKGHAIHGLELKADEDIDLRRRVMQKSARWKKHYGKMLWLEVNAKHFQNVKYWIERGADPNYQDGNGMTAFSVAVKQGFSQIAFYLIGHGADLQYRVEGRSCVQLAIDNKHFQLACGLIDKGAAASDKERKLIKFELEASQQASPKKKKLRYRSRRSSDINEMQEDQMHVMTIVPETVTGTTIQGNLLKVHELLSTLFKPKNVIANKHLNAFCLNLASYLLSFQKLSHINTYEMGSEIKDKQDMPTPHEKFNALMSELNESLSQFIKNFVLGYPQQKGQDLRKLCVMVSAQMTAYMKIQEDIRYKRPPPMNPEYLRYLQEQKVSGQESNLYPKIE